MSDYIVRMGSKFVKANTDMKNPTVVVTYSTVDDSGQATHWTNKPCAEMYAAAILPVGGNKALVQKV